MDRVTLFLRASLFSPPGPEPHVPPNGVIIVGNTSDRGGSGVTITIETMSDERGRPLTVKPVTVIVPWAKIDHVLLHES